MKRIASMYEGASRIAEINILLDKEITLLSGIDRQRQLVFEAMKDFRQEQLLKKMGEPIKWVGYGGKFNVFPEYNIFNIFVYNLQIQLSIWICCVLKEYAFLAKFIKIFKSLYRKINVWI